MAPTANELGSVHFWRIVRAIAAKELLQILRDRLTAALLIGVPLAQILLFGYPIEFAPGAVKARVSRVHTFTWRENYPGVMQSQVSSQYGVRCSFMFWLNWPGTMIYRQMRTCWQSLSQAGPPRSSAQEKRARGRSTGGSAGRERLWSDF
jgi:hypothetical protein